VIFPMLMRAISLTIYRTLDVTIHNKYPNIKLVSPVYFCNCGIHYEYPVEKTDKGVIMKIGFRLDLIQNEPGGILIYEMQIRGNAGSNRQSSIDTIYAKAMKETLKKMGLLVAWKIKRSKWHKAKITPTEYDNELVLNEDELAQLYNNVYNIPTGHSIFRETWLLCNDITLGTMRNPTRKAGLELEATIYETFRDNETIRSMWIDSERQVLSLIMKYTCTNLHVSLTIQSAIDMTINNQCTDIGLASPVCFIKDTTCHIQFPQQVNPECIMKAGFATGVDKGTFGGALLYRLRQKEDASASTQLLVIWGYKIYGLKANKHYLHAWLIEHESTLVWDKDKLKRLYDIYNNRWYTDSDLKTWLSNDNAELNVKCESLYKGFGMEIIISENENMFCPMKPLWVDPNR
jgi:hypothetical protein